MSNLLIQNATMVLPDTTVVGDLLIENGLISTVLPGGGLQVEGVKTIDASGLHLLPGIIDPQVHFRDPGQPEKEDLYSCLLYTSPSPRDGLLSRMPSSA